VLLNKLALCADSGQAPTAQQTPRTHSIGRGRCSNPDEVAARHKPPSSLRFPPQRLAGSQFGTASPFRPSLALGAAGASRGRRHGGAMVDGGHSC